MTKNVDIDKYKYSGYSIGFDRKGKFSVGNGFGNCLLYMFITKNGILILGEGPTQGLNGTTLTADKKDSINFTENDKKFCLRLHCNGANSYLFVNGTEIIKFKGKDSQKL